MNSNNKVGLVLGKFAPLHKGHQYLIEYAIARVDKLYVLVYEAAGAMDVPLSTRANWIRKIYPDVIIIEGHNSPTADNDTPEVMKLQDDYIASMMPEKITHFFSSEWYGEHVSKALGAENCLVDQKRTIIPISATKIRLNRTLAPKFLHPIVNRDIVKKVVFVGGESTGKSTLAAECAKLYHSGLVEEYGRQYWIENRDENGKLTSQQLLELASRHRQNEEEVYKISSGITFVDTNASFTKLFCKHYGLEVLPQLQLFVDQEKTRYDLFIVCNDDIPFVQDGTRNEEYVRKEFQSQIIEDLNDRGISYNIVSGTLNDRLYSMLKIISAKFAIYP